MRGERKGKERIKKKKKKKNELHMIDYTSIIKRPASQLLIKMTYLDWNTSTFTTEKYVSFPSECITQKLCYFLLNGFKYLNLLNSFPLCYIYIYIYR